MSRPPTRIRKLNQLSHLPIYQSNTYRKDLSWLYFEDEPRIHERQEGQHKQSYISSAISRAILDPLYQFGIPNSDPQILKNVRLVLHLFNVKHCLSLFIATDSHKNNVLSTTECQIAGLFRRGMQSHTHAPTHMQNCLDVW